MAYAGFKRPELAKKAHVSPATLDRITGKPQRGAEWSDLWRIADACGLDREWFSADLSRLHEIVTDGPTFARRLDGKVLSPDDVRRQATHRRGRQPAGEGDA